MGYELEIRHGKDWVNKKGENVKGDKEIKLAAYKFVEKLNDYKGLKPGENIIITPKFPARIDTIKWKDSTFQVAKITAEWHNVQKGFEELAHEDYGSFLFGMSGNVYLIKDIQNMEPGLTYEIALKGKYLSIKPYVDKFTGTEEKVVEKLAEVVTKEEPTPAVISNDEDLPF